MGGREGLIWDGKGGGREGSDGEGYREGRGLKCGGKEGRGRVGGGG